jgi:hypothetical protein
MATKKVKKKPARPMTNIPPNGKARAKTNKPPNAKAKTKANGKSKAAMKKPESRKRAARGATAFLMADHPGDINNPIHVDEYSIFDIRFFYRDTSLNWVEYDCPIEPLKDLRIAGLASPNSYGVDAWLVIYDSGAEIDKPLNVVRDGTCGWHADIDDDDNMFQDPAGKEYYVKAKREGPLLGCPVSASRKIEIAV